MERFKKFFLMSAVVALAFGQFPILGVKQVKAEEAQNVAQTSSDPKTYFLIGKNYFEDSSVSKGLLDQPVMSMTTPKAAGDNSLTYNQFYMKYNFAPEMTNEISNRYAENPFNYRSDGGVNNKTFLYRYNPDGSKMLDASGNHVKYADSSGLFQAGVNVPKVIDSFKGSSSNVNYSVKPLFFSYLYVGDGIASQSNNYQYTKDLIVPDAIGYNETNKFSDYMLNTTNNVVIPTRYNSERDDITLLMRSKTEIQTSTPQVQLTVTDENNNNVVGKSASPNYFIDTNISLHLTEFSFNRLGDGNAFIKPRDRYASVTKAFNGTTVGVDQYNTTMNKNLDTLRSYSSQGIVMGVGGATKLNGFYRAGLEAYTTSTNDRYEDQEKITNVSYYMWQKEPTPTDAGRQWSDAAKADLVDGIQYVFSPEVSKFKLSTTRPTITTDKPLTFDFNPATDVFNDLLGLGSILVEDTGVSMFADASGNAQQIPVDTDNVRVHVRLAAQPVTGAMASLSTAALTSTWSDPMTMAEFEASMADYTGETVDILYSYVATDADQSNVGKLPDAIANDTGAYAIPLLKTVTFAVQPTITMNYVVRGDETNPLFTETTTEPEGTPYTHTPPATYVKDGVTYALETDPAQPAIDDTYQGDKVFNFYYVEQSNMTVNYYIENTTDVLFTEITTKNKGTEFKHTAPATYEKDGKVYEYVSGPNPVDTTYGTTSNTFDFYYKLKDDVVTPGTDGQVIVRYVIGANEVLWQGQPQIGPENTPYTTTADSVYVINGKKYELIQTPANATGQFTDGITYVDYVYRPFGEVTATYYTTDNIELKPSEFITGPVGTKYTTTSYDTITVDNKVYVLTEMPANATGEYSETPTVVKYVYVYSREAEEETVGKVFVQYVNEQNEVLQALAPIEATEIGAAYNTSAPPEITINGVTYELVQERLPANATGVHTANDIYVYYVYKVKVTPPVDPVDPVPPVTPPVDPVDPVPPVTPPVDPVDPVPPVTPPVDPVDPVPPVTPPVDPVDPVPPVTPPVDPVNPVPPVIPPEEQGGTGMGGNGNDSANSGQVQNQPNPVVVKPGQQILPQTNGNDVQQKALMVVGLLLVASALFMYRRKKNLEK